MNSRKPEKWYNVLFFEEKRFLCVAKIKAERNRNFGTWFFVHFVEVFGAYLHHKKKFTS